jgi:hypothetical protein
MEPTRLLPIISVLLLVTVECGGYALLGLLTGQKLSEFQQTFFRAGDAHAGVLLVLSLVYFTYLSRTDSSVGGRYPSALGDHGPVGRVLPPSGLWAAG